MIAVCVMTCVKDKNCKEALTQFCTQALSNSHDSTEDPLKFTTLNLGRWEMDMIGVLNNPEISVKMTNNIDNDGFRVSFLEVSN